MYLLFENFHEYYFMKGIQWEELNALPEAQRVSL